MTEKKNDNWNARELWVKAAEEGECCLFAGTHNCVCHPHPMLMNDILVRIHRMFPPEFDWK